MTTIFEVISEEFSDDMEAIRLLVVTVSDPQKSAKVRVAAANSSTLLAAATFEEFVREMAREYARSVVRRTESFAMLPSKLASTAWKRTMDGLAKIRFQEDQAGDGTENLFAAAQARFTIIHDFCRGDLTKDIYRDLIHNENNMRPSELNSLFKVSGLSDVCKKLSDSRSILEAFNETDGGKAHGMLISKMEDFFDRRNAIAHALNPGQSSGPAQIGNDIDLLKNFGMALCETLNRLIQEAPSIETVPRAGSTTTATISDHP